MNPAEDIHSGYMASRKITGGFVIDCDGCNWRGFAMLRSDIDSVFMGHLAEVSK